MTPRERVWAALRGEPVDRPPVSFWGHFYDRESSARDLVDATLEFHRAFDWDWVKLNPRKHYHVEPWGVRYHYSGSAKPTLESWPVHNGSDWERIAEQAPDAGALGEQLEAVRLLKRALPADVPLIETVFTPLAILGEMVDVPATLAAHLRSHPEAVRRALEAVTKTYERYVRGVLDAGADGIYLATVDWASRDVMNAADYKLWARPYDLRLLGVAERAPFNVFHVCKQRNLLFEFADYPVAAFSWAATDPSNPSLADAHSRLEGALMGGISHDAALLASTPDQALSEFRQGLTQTGGRRWLVAPSCSISPTTSREILRAIRDAVENARLTGERSR